MHELRILGAFPPDELYEALLAVSHELGVNVCYAHHSRFHFSLGEGRSIAVSAESAGRIRVDTCRFCRILDTMWVLESDRSRLASLVGRLSRRISVA